MAADAGLDWGALQWQKDPPPSEWDGALAALSGHPLQSCLWGDARLAVDGIRQHRWLARRDGEPFWMIRVEERKSMAGKIAWAPRGPTGRTPALSLSVPPGFDDRLRGEGFSLLITDPWVSIEAGPGNGFGQARRARPQTIWLDLSLGQDVLFRNLHKHFRNGVRRAAKVRVTIEATRSPERIREFVDLSIGTGERKGFNFRFTLPFITAVLQASDDRRNVEAALLVALKDGRLGAGLLIMRAGSSVHLIAAATNRNMRQERVGEACQWEVIEWAVARGCMRYDLEGIDRVNNPSVYEFKKRLGGDEITLHGHIHVPLRWSGRAMSWLIQVGDRARPI